MDLIIRGGRIDGREGLWDVGAAGGRIAAIEERVAGSAPTELEARGGLIASSFVDVHTHLDKALTASRSAAAGRARSLVDAITELRAIKRAFTVEDVVRRATRVVEMSVACGTGIIRSNAEADPFVDLTVIRGMLDARRANAGIVDLHLTANPQEGWFHDEGGMEAASAPYIERALALGGLQAVGGNVNAALWPSSPERQVDEIFALAKRFDADLDLHLDNADDPKAFTLPYVIQQTVRHGYQGRVTVGHIPSLALVGAGEAADAIEAMRTARITVAVLPTRIRLTRVRELVEAGVNVVCSTDNQRDPFVRHGNADMLASMLLLTQLTHMTSDEELRAIWAMGTVNASCALRVDADYGLAVGRRADLVVLDEPSAPEAILHQAARQFVIKAGRLVAADGRILTEATRNEERETR